MLIVIAAFGVGREEICIEKGELAGIVIPVGTANPALVLTTVAVNVLLRAPKTISPSISISLKLSNP